MIKWETLSLFRDEESSGIYLLTLSRPEALNALNTQMALDLISCLSYLKEQKDIRTVILTGAGEKSFCVGADLKERNGMTNKEWQKQHDIFEEAFADLRNFPFPVIAAINGYALGGGVEMMLSCDLRVFSEHAKFGLPEVTIGIIPGVGGTQLLPRTIPVGIAKEILFSGKHISAARAMEVGLANEVVPIQSLSETALELARGIAKNAPLSLKSIKKAVNNGLQTDLNTALSIELDQYYKCANSEDRLEGIRSFNEKRKPVWQGK
ncbi:enoyl-CoA hydratase-related protein [Robertmurraya kyonggiensis]|uniref:Enoyl-CoA hydratase n=1 Tax=Robertmurraya kyonggiensis TaxID=1037680 RepID=A0A4U1DAE7_9BACI|nr:enoyl-CoA hydratase-related protein [Robertmurraya kyonggiensis]TKC19454.1 enoyl-CoA hydratase [Robertmurraya kyonggiensis]